MYTFMFYMFGKMLCLIKLICIFYCCIHYVKEHVVRMMVSIMLQLCCT